MSVFVSCSWCNEANEITGSPVYCRGCGHRGDVPRMSCDCQRCRQPVEVVDVRDQVLDVLLPPTYRQIGAAIE